MGDLTTTLTKFAIVCICMSALTSARANLLTNGSFESPGGYATANPGATWITGWVVINGQIDYDPGWQAADGLASLDLNGSPGVGGVEQTFATVPSQQYLVTFALAGNPDSQKVYTMSTQAAGQTGNFSFNSTGHTSTSMGWVTDSWTFTANASSTTLELYSTTTSTPYDGPALDNVIVTAIPEPSTVALLTVGVLPFLGIRKWKFTR
ncbi:MAG TPA: choice-of-anchor C family protein [Verrucomicrobiae bacterium]|nr:choice-of-anchor C family protein [Verrucomicrobiae bacterium]